MFLSFACAFFTFEYTKLAAKIHRKDPMMDRGCVWGLVVAGVLLAGCGLGTTQQVQSWPVGFVDRSVLSEPGYEAFAAGYDSARVDAQMTEFISMVRDDAEVFIFFGAWCGDSKREIPRFLKIADRAGFPGSAVKLYSLDRSKKSPDGLTEQYRIERVPTFIFMRQGGEIGRIVEAPSASLEQDMVAILAPRRD
jgi:thiol-disulfide isomerase/thioredoxin